jgi:hypothetical protein
MSSQVLAALLSALLGVTIAQPASANAGSTLSVELATVPTASSWEDGGDVASKAVLLAARSDERAWLRAKVHRRGAVTRDGLVVVEVTYRCQLPGQSIGSTEVYRVLKQHPGTSREIMDDGYDVDEFSCDGSRFTVPHAFSSETGRFHRGWARLTLDIRYCTGDVTDDPGVCFREDVRGWVRLRRGAAGR